MTGLARRISELERRLPPCPDCARATVKLLYANSPLSSRPRDERCHTCNRLLEPITVLLNFDPGPAGTP